MATLYIADAMRLGTLYDEDLRGAERWYIAAAQAGSGRALTGLALTYLAMGRREEAIAELRKATRLPYPPAFNILAHGIRRRELERGRQHNRPRTLGKGR
jgi:tetratricopeptide (TPR) repeat protein